MSLALLGGDKAVTLDYQQVGNRPLVSDKARAAVNALMDKGELSVSPIVREFEKKFIAYTGATYAIAMNNGTATLNSAVWAVGVEPGDEVLVPSYTFWATVVPIISARGTPVFCDVDPKTFCIDPAEIEKKITSKTKAIMVVHVWGSPCDMDAIMAIAKKHKLKVIEDCSHAHGAEYKGKKVGTIGDAGCFSMQDSKLLVAGEGGIMVTSDATVYARAIAFGHYERVRELPPESTYSKYTLTGMGYKYRAHPLGVAIANTEIDILDERNDIRDAAGRYLETEVAKLGFVVPQKLYDGVRRVYSYHYVNYDASKLGGVSMTTMLKALSAEGVICGTCGYGRLHYAPLFEEGGAYGECGPAEMDVKLPVTESLAQTTFMMAPRFENHCSDLVAQYIEAYRKLAANVDALVAYDKQQKQDDTAANSGRSINLFK